MKWGSGIKWANSLLIRVEKNFFIKSHMGILFISSLSHTQNIISENPLLTL